MLRTGQLLSVITLTFALVGPARAFELASPAGTCRGHEWLTVSSAQAAGIPSRYHASMEYGVRYVDLGGMTFAKDWFFGDMKIYVHRGPGSLHNHFTLRGGSKDLGDLIKDAAARVRELLDLALAVSPRRVETIVDGGMLSASEKQVTLSYFLLGAALHTIQDSFAHGRREPVWGRLPRRYKAAAMLKKWGGLNGTVFRRRGYYTRIAAAVLVPEPAAGTAKHNEVYTESQGGPRKSDKIWNSAICQLARQEHGNLMPHAFAAYLASRDFLTIFQSASRTRGGYKARVAKAHGLLRRYMQTWFRDTKGKFPGFGRAHGLCEGKALKRCARLVLPGEKGYVKPTASGVGSAVSSAAKFVGRKALSGAKVAGRKAASVVKKAGRKAASGVKKAATKAKKLFKKLKFW